MTAFAPNPERLDFFSVFRPPAMKLAECTCGHLKYTHRYLDAKLACTAWIPNEMPVPGVPSRCPCVEYTEIKNG